MKYESAYNQVFGQVNTSAPTKDGKQPMRVGKTARDKAKGHQPYKKNRRVFEGGSSGRTSTPGRWVKV